MNDSERRRRELLEQTRRRYSDAYPPPAVHPRYHAAYQELYGTEEERSSGTLGIRTLFCMILLVVFLSMEQGGETILDVSSEKVVEAVTTDIDLKESLDVLR